MADGSVILWGWDAAAYIYRRLEVDAGGHLQVVTAPGTAIATHCYGHDGANWRTLLVDRPADAFATPFYALEVMSFLMGFDGADWNMVRVDANGHLQVDVLSSALPTGAATYGMQNQGNQYINLIRLLLTARLPAALVGGALSVTSLATSEQHIYGFDGTNWQELLVESNVLKNLRVKLFDGANGIDSDELDSTIIPSGDRGILTRSQVCGYNLEPFHQRRSDADALAPVARELCQMNIALLYGWNGSTFDRLRTESSTAFNLRVKLYDGANGIDSSLQSSTTIADGLRGIITNACLRLSNPGVGNWLEWRNAGSILDANDGGTFACVSLMAWNGATFDRLRTYGTGILTVAKGAIAPTRIRMPATGRVGVAGAKKLFWIACSPDGPSAEWEITDADAGGGTVVYDHFDTDKHSDHIDFNPPMEFSTGIWVEKFDHMKSLVFCYQ